jgi:dienelactone hydrolase
VLIGHGAGGVTAAPKELASTVNKWGYNAVIIDHYTLRGITRHNGVEVQGATGKDRARDFIDAANWVSKQEWHQGKIAVVGFSQGGGGVLTLVDEKKMREQGFVTDKNPNPISAASAFYPSCYFNPVPREPSMPTQVHLAGEDDLARISFCYSHDRNLDNIHTYEKATLHLMKTFRRLP